MLVKLTLKRARTAVSTRDRQRNVVKEVGAEELFGEPGRCKHGDDEYSARSPQRRGLTSRTVMFHEIDGCSRDDGKSRNRFVQRPEEDAPSPPMPAHQAVSFTGCGALEVQISALFRSCPWLLLIARKRLNAKDGWELSAAPRCLSRAVHFRHKCRLCRFRLIHLASSSICTWLSQRVPRACGQSRSAEFPGKRNYSLSPCICR